MQGQKQKKSEGEESERRGKGRGGGGGGGKGQALWHLKVVNGIHSGICRISESFQCSQAC